MSGDDLLLPPEIWTQILTKLPVKSILRCRRVSKTWYSLISSPNFISDHSAQTLNQSTSSRVLVIRTDFETGMCKVSSHDESFVESHEHNGLTGPLRSQGVVIVGHCNGLICLRRKLDKTPSFLIWNPSIRKLVELPMPSSYASRASYLLGFGFDPESSDYKVLRAVFRKRNLTDQVLVESQIFDLKKGVWRRLYLNMQGLVEVPYHCAYLNGILHWIRKDGASDCTRTLLLFNLSSEGFSEMVMPPFGPEFDNYDTKISPINGLLSVSLSSRNWCSVWSMKEYGAVESWTKLFHIELLCNLTGWWTRLVRYWENGEVLILDQGGKKTNNGLVLYNPKSRESKVLSASGAILSACCYTESLVLL